jgi:hypothetical protein
MTDSVASLDLQLISFSSSIISNHISTQIKNTLKAANFMAVNNKKMPTLSATYRGICFKAPIFDYGGPVKTHCSENG